MFERMKGFFGKKPEIKVPQMPDTNKASRKPPYSFSEMSEPGFAPNLKTPLWPDEKNDPDQKRKSE